MTRCIWPLSIDLVTAGVRFGMAVIKSAGTSEDESFMVSLKSLTWVSARGSFCLVG